MDLDRPSVNTYLTFLQENIKRMASNSSSCKTWCITLLSALLVLSIDKEIYIAMKIVWFPLVLFFLLDSFYLSLEKNFRDIYNDFIKDADEKKLFKLTPPSGFFTRIISTILSFRSFSIWPFYGIIAVMFFVVKNWMTIAK